MHVRIRSTSCSVIGWFTSLAQVGLTRRLLNFFWPVSGAGKPESGGAWMTVSRIQMMVADSNFSLILRCLRLKCQVLQHKNLTDGGERAIIPA
jgi:hypothetical protein